MAKILINLLILAAFFALGYFTIKILWAIVYWLGWA